jgi:glutamate formiminotransferase / 5-formyltetrahydrofolate cyclo-ligase
MAVIECVPNVSEGRRLDRIAAMAEALARVPGLRVLDSSSDASHNRSVFTFAGGAAAVEAGVMALFERAVADIDLRAHRGEHPRLGAVDVVPLIPIAGVSMADCVALAKTIGAAVATRFRVPVYLYEEASTDPARTRLEDIRRGGFEGLAAKMSRAGWAPDFGPALPHPTAGATVVGARRALIAYNVNLATDRIDIAREIARHVRESGGGLPHVKALGLRLAERGLVQVSMNLTNYEETPIERVFEIVEREAARQGVRVAESELVGLIPAAALAHTTPSAIGLKNFRDQQILENRLKDE